MSELVIFTGALAAFDIFIVVLIAINILAVALEIIGAIASRYTDLTNRNTFFRVC